MNKYICSPVARHTPPTPSQEGSGCAVCREFTPSAPWGHLPLAGQEWMRAISLLLVVALLFAAITACTNFETNVPTNGTTDPYTIITVTIPGAQSPSTRSIADDGGEAEVTTVDLLVFENSNDTDESLAQHVVGEVVSKSKSQEEGYKVQFKAKLAKNPNATSIAIVANASASVVAAATPGSSKAEVLEALTFASTGTTASPYKWLAVNAMTYTPIPMYGEFILPEGGITPQVKIEEVELVRMLARIDLVNSDSEFMLTSVHLVNYQTAGYIAPAWKAEIPMIPESSLHRTGTDNALTYASSGGTVGTIYTYEAPATTGEEGSAGHTDAVCLIVEGTYQGKPNFYRIDFTNPKDAEGVSAGEPGFDPTQVEYMPVLRNHLYRFTISEVGVGHNTMDEAVRSLGICNNMKVSLLVVDESSIKNFVFNAEHYLGAAPLEAFDSEGGTTQMLVATNYAYGWQVDRIEYEGDTSDWLTVVKEQSADVKHCNLQLTAAAFTLSKPKRTAYIYLKAGTLEYKVTVIQNGMYFKITDYSTGQPVTNLSFNSKRSLIGIAPQPRQLLVEWSPATRDVTIVNQPGDPALTLSTPIATTLTGGSYVLTIDPEGIQQSELNINPFVSKSTALRFTLVGTDISQTIGVNQKHYDLYTDGIKNYYYADGKRYTFNVISNANWRIASFTEKPHTPGKTLLAQGPTKNGDTQVAFTTSNQMGNDVAGNVVVVFENSDTPKIFDDISTTMNIDFGFFPTSHGGWAGSNIYYDEVNEHLTFDDVGVTTHRNVQGVFFKWGSLTGITPALNNGQTSFSSSTSPTYPPGGGSKPAGISYSNIPVLVPPSSYTIGDRDPRVLRAYLYEMYNEASGVGDICRHLSEKGWSPPGKWRMPTVGEYQTLFNSSTCTLVGGGSSEWKVSTTDPTGLAPIFPGYEVTGPEGSIFFPGASYRNDSGTLATSARGNYWSSCIGEMSSIRRGYMGLDLHYNSVPKFGNTAGTGISMAVRCVRE